ncbi:MAG: serine hydrolase domain-containing protein [Micropepsaceae bacterium]
MEERRLTPLTAAICTLVLGLAIEPANAAPNKAPMSDRLSAIDAFFEDEVSNHRLPGAVALVVRDDKVIYLKAFGERDPAAHEPMRVDTLFRLYSMSKPIATVAALQLVEDGRLHLDDPVAKYIPEFASVQVYAPPFVPGGPKELEQKLLPAKHAPTIHDLVRHTSGLTYGQGGPANWRDYQATNLIPETWQKTDILIALTNAEVARRAASVPLAFEPGTQWAYGRSTDVLGRVIEVASGKPLDEYLADGLFKPLGMKDTVFNLSPQQLKRAAQPGPAQPGADIVHFTDLSRRRTFFAAGAGLVGTAGDYARFCRVLLNGGALGKTRVLGQQTVALMMSDQIGTLADHPGFNLDKSYTFGLGGFVRRARDPKRPYANVGEFGWWGGGGTAFWVDPSTRLCGVLLTQQPDESRYYSEKFRALVYQTIAARP